MTASHILAGGLHFPEGPRMLGLHGAELIFIPSATSRGLSMHLWEIEQRSHAIFNGVFVGTINRVGQEPELGRAQPEPGRERPFPVWREILGAALSQTNRR